MCVCISSLFELYYNLCAHGSCMPMQPNMIFKYKVYKSEDAKGGARLNELFPRDHVFVTKLSAAVT